MTSLVRAQSIAHAIDVLADEDAHALAGGQALIILLKEGFVQASCLVDLSGLTELRAVACDSRTVQLGALCTHGLIATNPTVRAGVPGLAAAFAEIGNVRVRAAGTLGGNLAHADPRQDPPPALVVLDAVATVQGRYGNRRVAVADLIDGFMSTTLAHDELITAVHVPVLGARSWFGFAKFLAGSSEGFAAVNAALLIDRSLDGAVGRVRTCVGALVPVPQLVDLTAALGGAAGDVTHADADLAALAVADALAPVVDGDYACALAGEVVRGLVLRYVSERSETNW